MLKEVFIRKYDDSSSAFSKYTLKHDTIRRPYCQFSRQAKLLGANCQFLQVLRINRGSGACSSTSMYFLQVDSN